MLRIYCKPLGLYQTNCYIIRRPDSNRCILIDPGYEAEKILDFLQDNHLTLDTILLTHCHFDHVGAVRELAAETDCRVWLHQEDLSLPPQITAGPLYYTDLYPQDGQLTAAGIPVLVIPTPGHTPGGVCLIMEEHMFSGDTLFAGSCGRTDLPGGDYDTIQASLKKLAALPRDYQVHPGHGESTTLAEEKRYNPYMR